MYEIYMNCVFQKRREGGTKGRGGRDRERKGEEKKHQHLLSTCAMPDLVTSVQIADCVCRLDTTTIPFYR